ncbi:class I SAM-dependent methyltransferase [candidate division KSB1 bacterium]
MKWLENIRLHLAAFCLPFKFRKIAVHDPGDFYKEAAEYFEAFFADEKDDDVQFYLDFLRTSGSPVLDAACGNARIMMPVASAGHTVAGFDNSLVMLDLARRKIRELPREIRDRTHLAAACMTNIPFKEFFRLAVIPYNSFNHLLTEHEQRSCLSGIYKALSAGGWLVVEILPFHERYYQGVRFRKSGYMPDTGKRAVLYSSVLHDKENKQHTVTWYIIEKSGRGRTKRLMSRFTRKDIPQEVMVSLLEEAGFIVETTRSSYYGETKSGDKCILICRKS